MAWTMLLWARRAGGLGPPCKSGQRTPDPRPTFWAEPSRPPRGRDSPAWPCRTVAIAPLPTLPKSWKPGIWLALRCSMRRRRRSAWPRVMRSWLTSTSVSDRWFGSLPSLSCSLQYLSSSGVTRPRSTTARPTSVSTLSTRKAAWVSFLGSPPAVPVRESPAGGETFRARPGSVGTPVGRGLRRGGVARRGHGLCGFDGGGRVGRGGWCEGGRVHGGRRVARAVLAWGHSKVYPEIDAGAASGGAGGWARR